MSKARENVLMQLGDYCTHHKTCEKCPLNKLAKEYHHGCPEFLRIPELAHLVSDALAHRRVRKDFPEVNTDG